MLPISPIRRAGWDWSDDWITRTLSPIWYFAMIALYARVSTRDKDQNPETQLLPLRAWAEAQGEPYRVYVDEASATDLAGRKQWALLVRDAYRGDVQRVRVLRLDRAFRDVLHLHAQLRDWQLREVEQTPGF